jgi:isopenicillin N synthase-like dioxygenase
MNVAELAKTGYVPVEYPDSLREAVHRSMRAWKDFCTLPLLEKSKLSGGDRVNDHGYMIRGDSKKADGKELFHLVEKTVPTLRAQVGAVNDRGAVRFIEEVDTLIGETLPLVINFAERVESEYKIQNFARDVRDSSGEWTFRFLHYFPGAPAFAHAHADRGGFTLHLHESAGGGQYMDMYSREWRDWPISETQTIIFPSMHLQQRSLGTLKALWHRVVPTEDTSQTGRFSMVAFIDFRNLFVFNKNAGIRMQDLPDGSTYDDTPDSFQRFFVLS